MSVIEARPVVTRIGEEIFNRLRRLTANFDVACPVSEVIQPLRLGGYTPKHLQIVLTRGRHTRVEALDCPGNPMGVAWQQAFNIRCHILPSEKDTTPVDEYCDTIAAAVVKVICDSGARWHTIGELAIDARFSEWVRTYSDGSFDGINVPLSVIYRTDENNPYNVRA